MAEATTEERWLPVVGHPGYEVSDHGRVRSLDRVVVCVDGRKLSYRGQMLKLREEAGYHKVCLSRRQWRKVYLLVLEAFVGPRPPGMVGCHRDDVGTNNRLTNLRWDTISSNQKDRVRNGRNEHANKTHCPQNHPLSGANLVPSQLLAGKRGCLACNRAYTMIAWRKKSGGPVPEVGALADSYYADIVLRGARVAPRRTRGQTRRPTAMSGDQTEAS